MVDLVVTPASVVAGSSATVKHGTSGDTLTAGKVLYQDSADKKWKLADNNNATAEIRQATAIALNGASSGQPVSVLTRGPVTIGSTLVAGTAYYLSDTPGGICAVADIGAGEYVCLLGVSTSTTVLEVDFSYSGVAL